MDNNDNFNNSKNIDLLSFFMPLMSETLHLLGQNLDIETIKSKIYQLVEQNQIELNLKIFDSNINTNANVSNNFNEKNIQLIKKAQFAVYAWVDEKILTSEINAAIQWSNYALQNTYFNTSEAGYLFYKNLDDILTDFFDMYSINIVIDDNNNDNNKNNANQQMITEKLTKFTEQLSNNHYHNNSNNIVFINTIKIYALCILYGFLGQYHNDNNVLKSLRKNAYYILHNNVSKNQNILTSTNSNFDFLLQQGYSTKLNENIIPKSYLEIALYIVIPVIFCIIFVTFSANLLLQSPFNL